MSNRDARQLALKRETVRDLTGEELGNAAGGTVPHTGAWPTDFCTIVVIIAEIVVAKVTNTTK